MEVADYLREEKVIKDALAEYTQTLAEAEDTYTTRLRLLEHTYGKNPSRI